MWPGQQPPGGEQNPQDQNPQSGPNPYQQPGYQQPNPYQQPGYQQPGYQQPNPYQQEQPGQQSGQQWSVPTVPMGAASPPPNDDRRKNTIIAIVAATAVVVAAGVTGFLVLGGDKEDTAGGDGKGKKTKEPSATAPKAPGSGDPSGGSDDNPRDGSNAPKPVVKGWQVVVNPKWGTAFDVPKDWELQSPDTLIGFEDAKKSDGKPLITMSAPAYYKSKWCSSDDDKDGTEDDTALAAVGTKGANGAKDTNEVAVNQVPWWVFGGYTQPDKKSLTFDKKGKPFTTDSGVEGMVARAKSTNTPQKGKCASDGKAITFGFKNSKGDFVAWNLYGATGVDDEVPEATVLKILKSVRLHGEPTG